MAEPRERPVRTEVIPVGGALLGVIASFAALYFITRDVQRRSPRRPRDLPTLWPRMKRRRK